MLLQELFQNKIQEADLEHKQELSKTGFWGKSGAGCLFLAKNTGRICIAHRSTDVQEPGTWGTWGGAIDKNESPEQAVAREIKEETGYSGAFELVPLFVFKHDTGFVYYNFLAIVDEEFTPQMNWETQGFDWAKFGDWPSPIHPGLRSLLNDSASNKIIRNYASEFSKNDKEIIKEGATDILYHYTSIPSADKILSNGEFHFSSTTGTDVERELAPRGEMYYLSTTRSRRGRYHAKYAGFSSGVMFVLDGRWIEQRYKVKPVDYWGTNSFSRNEFDARESEDRIFSNKNTMPITPVVEIHIFIRDFPSSTAPLTTVKNIVMHAKENNIRAYLYDNSKNWVLQNKAKSIPIDSLQKYVSQEKQRELYDGPGYLDKWIELIDKNSKAQLSQDADRARYSILWYSDSVESLKVDMHNSRKPGTKDYDNVVKINTFMKRNKLNTLKDFIQFLKNKWSETK